MHGTISWFGLLGLIVFAVLWEGYFNAANRTPRLPRWLRPRPKQKGLMPPASADRSTPAPR